VRQASPKPGEGSIGKEPVGRKLSLSFNPPTLNLGVGINKCVWQPVLLAVVFQALGLCHTLGLSCCWLFFGNGVSKSLRRQHRQVKYELEDCVWTEHRLHRATRWTQNLRSVGALASTIVYLCENDTNQWNVGNRNGGRVIARNINSTSKSHERIHFFYMPHFLLINTLLPCKTLF
jgi:hypothetical protein